MYKPTSHTDNISFHCIITPFLSVQWFVVIIYVEIQIKKWNQKPILKYAVKLLQNNGLFKELFNVLFISQKNVADKRHMQKKKIKRTTQ